MTRLIRSELLKIRTTNGWWWLGIGALVWTALAFTANAFTANFMLSEDNGVIEGMDPEQAAELAAQQGVLFQAANLYTSGQFFGLLLVMLVGILAVTNEFYHQTATTTFLTTPRRTAVIAGKLATAVLIGFAFWLVTTVIDVVASAIFLEAAGYGSQLGEWAVTRAILLNLLAYVIWTIFGVGFGTLITNQIGAVVTACVAYVIGTFAAQAVFALLAAALDNQTINKLQVVVPSIASQLMISGDDLPGNPPQWVGAVVLLAYAAVTGAIGVLITRRRDIT